MAELKFLEVRCGEEKELALLAERLWHSAYDDLLGKTQVDYMVDLLQSALRCVSRSGTGIPIILSAAAGRRSDFAGCRCRVKSCFCPNCT